MDDYKNIDFYVSSSAFVQKLITSFMSKREKERIDPIKLQSKDELDDMVYQLYEMMKKM